MLYISEVRNFVLYFIEGYYKVALCRLTYVANEARTAQAHNAHHAVQSVVCCNDLTSKLLVTPSYINVCPFFALGTSSHCKHENRGSPFTKLALSSPFVSSSINTAEISA